LAFLTAKDLSESFRQFLASANTFERNSLFLKSNCRIVFELFGIGKLVTPCFCRGICRGFSNTSQFCNRPYIYARAWSVFDLTIIIILRACRPKL